MTDDAGHDRPPQQAPRGGGQVPQPGRITRFMLWFILLLLVMPWFFRMLGIGVEPRISYSEFRQKVAAGEVEVVTIKGERIRGELAAEPPGAADDGASDDPPPSVFVTFLPTFGDDGLLEMLEANDVEVRTEPNDGSLLPMLLFGLLPLVLLLGFGWVLFRRMGSQGGQILSIGKSSARL
ncbi:MAG TPA: ATP-dependent metallopeptidase FtsH/Yme1/Tma family protein, partial [Chondromyces sp.]|nr:ATP-dependent metallopeptidase FtsH/Yme1/Tma family protein [Chondromyces sp.]